METHEQLQRTIGRLRYVRWALGELEVLAYDCRVVEIPGNHPELDYHQAWEVYQALVEVVSLGVSALGLETKSATPEQYLVYPPGSRQPADELYFWESATQLVLIYDFQVASPAEYIEWLIGDEVSPVEGFPGLFTFEVGWFFGAHLAIGILASGQGESEPTELVIGVDEALLAGALYRMSDFE